EEPASWVEEHDPKLGRTRGAGGVNPSGGAHELSALNGEILVRFDGGPGVRAELERALSRVSVAGDGSPRGIVEDPMGGGIFEAAVLEERALHHVIAQEGEHVYLPVVAPGFGEGRELADAVRPIGVVQRALHEVALGRGRASGHRGAGGVDDLERELARAG